jgi:RNA binding exosome subunit
MQGHYGTHIEYCQCKLKKNQLITAHKVLMQLTDRFIIMKTWKEDNTNAQINITGSVLSVNLRFKHFNIL